MNLKITRLTYAIGLFLLLLVAGLGCNNLLPPEPDRLGYQYFPLTLGEFRIYRVKVINYNLDGTTDTLNYQLKEVVADTSTLGTEISYRLDRFRRTDATQPWVIDSVWSARVNTYQAIVVENNIPIIKLSFPLMENRRWDGNAMNALDFDEFKIKNLDFTYQMDGTDYPNSLEMFMDDLLDPNKITNDDFHLEIFSKGIGLIHKLDTVKQYCNPGKCQETGVIEQGKVVDQKLLQIGNEN